MDLQKHSSVYSGSIQSKQCEPDKKFAVESFQAVAGNCVLKCEDIKHVLSPASVKLVWWQIKPIGTTHTESTSSIYTACLKKTTVRLFPAVSCGTLGVSGQTQMVIILVINQAVMRLRTLYNVLETNRLFYCPNCLKKLFCLNKCTVLPPLTSLISPHNVNCRLLSGPLYWIWLQNCHTNPHLQVSIIPFTKFWSDKILAIFILATWNKSSS